MVKPNFFKAIAAGVVLFRVFKYIGNQKRLLEQWDYKIKTFKLSGFDGFELKFNLSLELDNRSGANLSAGMFDFDVFVDGIRIGRAISNDFVDIQPYSTSVVNFDLRVRPKDLQQAGKKLLDIVMNAPGVKIKIVGAFSMETLPGIYKSIPVNYEDTVINILG